MSDYFGKEVFKLGFGLMRLPKLADGSMDIEQIKGMGLPINLSFDASSIDSAIENVNNTKDEDAPHLDAQYAAFGRVTSGMEVVDKIAGVKTGRYGFYSDVPRTCIVITDATVAE